MKKAIIIFVTVLITAGPAIGQNYPDDSACYADFTWKENTMIMMFAPGMAINFYDRSVGNVNSWHWDFGDGNYSEEQDPLHIFTFLPGTDNDPDGTGVFVPEVCLTITTKDSCSSTICKTIDMPVDTLIYPDTGCYVYFYAYPDKSEVTIPEIIPYAFRVEAPLNTISYSWDFGDGTVSEEPNPVHGFYFLGGVYEVCLKIETADGCATSYCAPIYIGNTDTIEVPDCQASYNYDVMESYPEQFAFHDLSSGNPTTWFWDFGDGTYSDEQNPVHMFQVYPDTIDEAGNFIPSFASYYKVCLTIVNDSLCESTYCDYVYPGIWHDTIYPDPCPYFISVTTSNILGGNFCNGTASASLVDKEGNPVESANIYWSAGETGDKASGLCVNVPYYVSLTAPEGCQVAGSFAIIDYTRPMDPFGFWTINGDGYWYDLNYNIPDSGYACSWTFSDGTVLYGDNVSYGFEGSSGKNVILTVRDKEGNVVYTEDIALAQPVAVKETKLPRVHLFPNPADDYIHIQFSEPPNTDIQVDIYNSVGQLMMSRYLPDEGISGEITMPVDNLLKGIYYARILTKGKDPLTIGFVK